MTYDACQHAMRYEDVPLTAQSTLQKKLLPNGRRQLAATFSLRLNGQSSTIDEGAIMWIVYPGMGVEGELPG